MLNERVSPQLLGVVRILVFSLWLANVSMVHLEDIVRERAVEALADSES